MPLTADDVVWTFNWVMNPSRSRPRGTRAYLQKLRRMVTQDRPTRSVRFEFNEPYFDSDRVWPAAWA